MRLRTTTMLMLLCQFLLAQQPLLNKTFADYEGNVAWSIIPENDGYILAGGGWSDMFDGHTAIKILKVDPLGTLEWKKEYGQVGWGYYLGNSAAFIKSRNSKGYIGFGSINNAGISKALIVKFDESGDTIWTATFSNSNERIFYHGMELSNGDIVGAGTSTSTVTSGDFLLLVTDSSGNLKWQKTYGGNGFQGCRRVVSSIDGGFILSGSTDNGGTGLTDFYLIKTDSVGNMEWDRVYGTSWKEYYAKITYAASGAYYFWGESQDEDMVNGFPTYEKKTILTKIREDGSEVWSKTLHQDFLYWGYLNQVREVDEEGNLVLVGEREFATDSPSQTLSLAWVTKLDSSGNKIWERYYKGPTDSVDYPAHLKDFQITPNGNIACTGYAMDTGVIFGWQQNFWLLVLDSMGCLVPGCDTLVGTENVAATPFEARLYPNPTAGKFTVELPLSNSTATFSLYNLLGQKVFSETLTEPRTTLSLGLSSGMYLYRIERGGGVRSGKLIIE